MTVSVVIPLYNNEETIQRAIESVLAQSIDDFEVLVVDDASTDQSLSATKQLSIDKVTVLTHETNRGGAAARNTGISHASGDYVAFLDADDEWHPQKLEKQLEALTTNPDVDIVYCNYRKVRARECVNRIQNHIHQRELHAGGDELLPLLLSGRMPLGGASTLLMRTETANSVDGFDEAFQRHQDWEFLIRLLRDGRSISYVDEALLKKYETDPPAVSTLRDAKNRFLRKFASEVVTAELSGYPVLSTHRLELVQMNLANGDIRQGIREFRVEDVLATGSIVPVCYSLVRGFI